MKTKTLLSRLSGLLADPNKDKLDEIKALRGVLSNLKQKEIEFRRKQSLLTGDTIEQEELQLKLEVIHAQRRKGIERILKLRQELRNETKA